MIKMTRRGPSIIFAFRLWNFSWNIWWSITGRCSKGNERRSDCKFHLSSILYCLSSLHIKSSSKYYILKNTRKFENKKTDFGTNVIFEISPISALKIDDWTKRKNFKSACQRCATFSYSDFLLLQDFHFQKNMKIKRVKMYWIHIFLLWIVFPHKIIFTISWEDWFSTFSSYCCLSPLGQFSFSWK